MIRRALVALTLVACAVGLTACGDDVHVGSTTWKVQMEWSNAAYNAGTGFANLSGENGCIQGN